MIKFIRYFLFFLTLLYAPIRWSARRTLKGYETWIVINSTANIGDMVCTTPIFRAIKVANPHARVVVVGTRKNRDTMMGNTDIDRYISLDGSFWAVLKDLRKENADAGVVVNLGANDFALLFLGGVKRISCFGFINSFRKKESYSYTIVSRLGIRTQYSPGKYVPRQYLRLLEPFSIISDCIEKHVGFTKSAENKILKQFAEHGLNLNDKIVAIAPGAGTKIKQWPAERFGQIANYLQEKYGLGIVIIGGPKDINESEQMMSVFDKKVRYVNCIGQTLDELKATLSKVGLIIGNDSAPIYIAESFGVATLVIVGPTDEDEHPLQDELHRVVKAKNRGKALLQSYLSSEDTINLDIARSQIEAITFEDVQKELDNLLENMKIEVAE